jgi:hypothetical protein
VWSDKTTINMLGSNRKNWAWKKGWGGLSRSQQQASDRLVSGTVKFPPPLLYHSLHPHLFQVSPGHLR